MFLSASQKKLVRNKTRYVTSQKWRKFIHFGNIFWPVSSASPGRAAWDGPGPGQGWDLRDGGSLWTAPGRPGWLRRGPMGRAMTAMAAAGTSWARSRGASVRKEFPSLRISQFSAKAKISGLSSKLKWSVEKKWICFWNKKSNDVKGLLWENWAEIYDFCSRDNCAISC